MKFLVAFAVAVACASADVSHILKDEYNAPVVKSSYEISPEGAFQYVYETGNGISAQAAGTVKNANGEYPTLEVQGGFKYTAPDGTPVETSYIANENGFQPQGSHIPLPPPIPEAIARSLAYIAAHPPHEETYKKPSSAFSG